jgi:hypothetical protein
MLACLLACTHALHCMSARRSPSTQANTGIFSSTFFSHR